MVKIKDFVFKCWKTKFHFEYIGDTLYEYSVDDEFDRIIR